MEKGKRNEKQSNEHIEIFCCFCFFLGFVDTKMHLLLNFDFVLKGQWGMRASRLSEETSWLNSELKFPGIRLGFCECFLFSRKVNA